ncbi:MAG TPA: helix-turn-helix transcriptional regulator [Thermodesulfovibrionales bacterium]|jgi:DNA-binding XRE family transcriptional regulator|nr:helix-turn-helix transcriptional regulator [Thermodesulfovibrionales bacterium]
MAKLKDLKKLKVQWLKDPEVLREYEALQTEFQLAKELIKARTKAKVTQAELARRIGTKSTAISRLESPNYGKASISMLKKVAQALGCELQIRLVPKHQ